MKNFDLRAAIHDPLFVSETMLVSKLLELFKNSGKDFAIVLDEHGGTAGVVTAMNLLQSLVGEISTDEGDEDTQVFANADGSWLLGGALIIEDIPDFFDSKLARIEVPGDYQTLAGFIFTRLSKIPRIGEEFIWNKLKFRILKMEKNRIIQVFVSSLVA